MDGRTFPLAWMTLALSVSLVALSLSVHLSHDLIMYFSFSHELEYCSFGESLTLIHELEP